MPIFDCRFDEQLSVELFKLYRIRSEFDHRPSHQLASKTIVLVIANNAKRQDKPNIPQPPARI